MTITIIFIALLVAISATYNAYLLRGGKLALSQILMVFGMISLIFSLLIPQVMVDRQIFAGFTITNFFFMLGFCLLLAASLRLRHAFK